VRKAERSDSHSRNLRLARLSDASYHRLVKTLSVKLPEPLAQWIERRSRKLNRTQSEVVRAALERERDGRGQAKSCRDLLAELDGFFDGPKDLSTNPKHFEDFGR
jgi:predicted DNA-binding protein